LVAHYTAPRCQLYSWKQKPDVHIAVYVERDRDDVPLYGGGQRLSRGQGRGHEAEAHLVPTCGHRQARDKQCYHYVLLGADAYDLLHMRWRYEPHWLSRSLTPVLVFACWTPELRAQHDAVRASGKLAGWGDDELLNLIHGQESASFPATVVSVMIDLAQARIAEGGTLLDVKEAVYRCLLVDGHMQRHALDRVEIKHGSYYHGQGGKKLSVAGALNTLAQLLCLLQLPYVLQCRLVPLARQTGPRRWRAPGPRLAAS
jgi:hypothetical protein